MENTVSFKIEPIIGKLLKNYELYSYRLEKYPDKKSHFGENSNAYYVDKIYNNII